MSNRQAKILMISAAFPSNADPSRGIFVYQRARALSEIPGIEVRVIAPTPWVPPLGSVPKFHDFLKLPHAEVFGGLQIDRPRYPLVPKIGGYFHPQLMHASLLKAAHRVRREYEFDMIDAHWVYPTGVAATRIARMFHVPVCLTGRGEDMTRFPSLPLKGKSIRWALQNADFFVGVSQEIADAMVTHGARSDRVTTIANGVDVEKFRPQATKKCRKLLGLPLDRRILITVGDRLELKGFHLVIEALPSILKKHPDAMYVCVGGPGRHGRDYTDEIVARVQRLGLSDRVLLAGPREHDELVRWYNAADLYVLASSREGSPNVLLEARACGVPAVATDVGGARDELEPTGFGLIMADQTPQAAAESINQALTKHWDREGIRRKMEGRSWSNTATAVLHHVSSLLPEQETSAVRA